MTLITRDYLQQLIRVIGTRDIKIITGVRRAGKSTLLQQFADYIQQHVDNANLIHINFNLTTFEKLKDRHQLDAYVEKHYRPHQHNFVLIDEIQLCANFELPLNSWHAQNKFDIFVTGSNAFLLSSDLATLFTGRSFTIPIFPFSFGEYCRCVAPDTKPDNHLFDQYFFYGGMAGSFDFSHQADKYHYLDDVFSTLIIRDIVERHHLENPALLDKICDFLLANISNLTSSTTISNTLTSSGQKTNHNTINNYLKYLTEAYAFYRLRRYDIQGKKYLQYKDKYYLCDHSFRLARLGTKNLDRGQILENIVAIELLRRGFQTYVGTLRDSFEVDFVADKRGQRLYIQVCEDLSSPATLEREKRSLLAIRDAYPKFIITRQPYDSIVDGIQVVDIIHWLTDNTFSYGL